MVQEMKFKLLLIIKPTLLHYQAHSCRWPSLLSLMAYANPVKPPWCTTGYVGPVNGINKDVTGARLLSTTVLTCPVD